MLEAEGYTYDRTTGSHHIFTKPGKQHESIPVHKGLGNMATSKEFKSSKGAGKARPFAPAIVAKAAALTPLYQVIVRWDADEEAYAGRCVEMPNAIGFGDTEAECLAEVRGNINALVSYLIETGETPPLADEPDRKAQVNVRFADYEKATAEALAEAAGKTLSDYIRVAALRGT